MTKTYRFKHCWVHTSPGYTETVFDDDTKVAATPEDSDEYRAKASRYGYGDDINAMSREHEILHTFLAEKVGFGSSPTIWALAHPTTEGVAEVWQQMEEETFVLAFQVFLNGGEPSAELRGLTDAGLDLHTVRFEALKLLMR